MRRGTISLPFFFENISLPFGSGGARPETETEADATAAAAAAAMLLKKGGLADWGMRVCDLRAWLPFFGALLGTGRGPLSLEVRWHGL